MTRIDGFNPNLPPINPNVNAASSKKQDKADKETKNANTNFKSSEEILNYLANTGYTPVEAQKQNETSSKTVIPVSQYVNPDQAKEIARSVQAFQNLHNNISTTAQKELSISPDLANQVALETIENKYMPA